MVIVFAIFPPLLLATLILSDKAIHEPEVAGEAYVPLVCILNVPVEPGLTENSKLIVTCFPAKTWSVPPTIPYI